MQLFTKPTFQVSGYKVTIPNQKEAQSIIQAAWQKFMHQGLHKLVENKEYPQVMAIYYNYTNLNNSIKEGYDMLLGFNTIQNIVQSSQEFTTISVPTQDYKYIDFEGDFQELLPIKWTEINNLPISDLNRTHKFDLEIYSEDYKTCTIAVGVI